MKKIKILSLIVLSIIITGCGGGGDSSFEHVIVNLTVKCTTTSSSIPTNTDILTYLELFSGDKVVEDQAGTVVQFYSSINGNSRVCLESGLAHIVRN